MDSMNLEQYTEEKTRDFFKNMPLYHYETMEPEMEEWYQDWLSTYTEELVSKVREERAEEMIEATLKKFPGLKEAMEAAEKAALTKQP